MYISQTLPEDVNSSLVTKELLVTRTGPLSRKKYGSIVVLPVAIE